MGTLVFLLSPSHSLMSNKSYTVATMFWHMDSNKTPELIISDESNI